MAGIQLRSSEVRRLYTYTFVRRIKRVILQVGIVYSTRNRFMHAMRVHTATVHVKHLPKRYTVNNVTGTCITCTTCTFRYLYYLYFLYNSKHITPHSYDSILCFTFVRPNDSNKGTTSSAILFTNVGITAASSW